MSRLNSRLLDLCARHECCPLGLAISQRDGDHIQSSFPGYQIAAEVLGIDEGWAEDIATAWDSGDLFDRGASMRDLRRAGGFSRRPKVLTTCECKWLEKGM